MRSGFLALFLVLMFGACAKGEAAGQEGEPCSSGACDEGLLCVRDLCVSPNQGGLRQACYPNRTCNDGLSCISGLCVAPDSGGLLQKCYPDESCDAGLVCHQARCLQQGEGGENQPCYPNDTCDDGFACVEGGCFAPGGGGGSGQAGSGAGGSAGQPGGAGTEAGGTSAAGTSGSGAGGVSGTSGGGQGGSGVGCPAPDHVCNGLCVGNTPSTGCWKSTSCTPCVPPPHGTSTCNSSGFCDFVCDKEYKQVGNSCIAQGAGGASGAGGTGGTGGSTGASGSAPCETCAGTCPTKQIDQACAKQCFDKGCFECTVTPPLTCTCGC